MGPMSAFDPKRTLDWRRHRQPRRTIARRADRRIIAAIMVRTVLASLALVGALSSCAATGKCQGVAPAPSTSPSEAAQQRSYWTPGCGTDRMQNPKQVEDTVGS